MRIIHGRNANNPWALYKQLALAGVHRQVLEGKPFGDLPGFVALKSRMRLVRRTIIGESRTRFVRRTIIGSTAEEEHGIGNKTSGEAFVAIFQPCLLILPWQQVSCDKQVGLFDKIRLMVFVELHEPLHVPNLFHQAPDRQLAGHPDKDAVCRQAPEIFELYFEGAISHGNGPKPLYDPLFHECQLGEPQDREIGPGTATPPGGRYCTPPGGRYCACRSLKCFMKSCLYLPDPVAKLFVRVQDQLVFVGGKLVFVVLVENGGHRFDRLLHDLIRLKVMWRQDCRRARNAWLRTNGFGLKPKDINSLTGVEGVCSLQEHQLIHLETVMKGLARILGHRLVVQLLGEPASNAQKRPGDEVCGGAARGADEFIDGSKLLHELPERMRILHPEIYGMRRKTAVIVER
jgi:hypothetical protein